MLLESCKFLNPPDKPLNKHFRYMNIFLSTWGLMVSSMIFTAPMVYLRVTDHTDVEDETQ